ncbi:MAG TPA: aldo/keto reductase [Burkholderiales bacterium]|nr:aldo/keto reductase [Burkholderiales bacterium]
MQQRNLGKSELKVSVVGLGCNNFGGDRCDLAASRQVIHKALDLGITHIDTADVYGNRGESETILGKCLGDRRKDVVLATKFGIQMDEAGTLKGGSRRYIQSAIEASLKRLNTDWIDLYYIHRPDPLTPIEETLRTLDDLVKAGKVRYIGCSGYAAWQMVEAQWTATHHGLNRFVTCQDEYNLLKRGFETALQPAMQAYGLGLIPHTPLAAGLLSGKYRRDAPLPAGARIAREKRQADRWISDANWEVVERLTAFCEARGHTLLELAMSWLASHPLVASIIAGATTPEQVELNARAVDWRLSADDLAAIDKATRRGGT